MRGNHKPPPDIGTSARCGTDRNERWIGKRLCRRGYHWWNLAFRREGEHQHCERPSCTATAWATKDGWKT
jgi:hypothetical protein